MLHIPFKKGSAIMKMMVWVFQKHESGMQHCNISFNGYVGMRMDGSED